MFPRGNSMDSEILTWLLIAACAAGFGGGAAWQAMRRRAPARTRRNVDKVAARPVKASPAPKAPAPAPEERKPQHGVRRPSMLALTTLENSVIAADLFIQRALEVDEPYYRGTSRRSRAAQGPQGALRPLPHARRRAGRRPLEGRFLPQLLDDDR